MAKFRDYREKVKILVSKFILAMPIKFPINWDGPAWMILMGFEHERIHIEKSSVLMRQLPFKWVKHLPYWPVCAQAHHGRGCVRTDVPIAMPGGRVQHGKIDDTYCWDNEYGNLQIELSP